MDFRFDVDVPPRVDVMVSKAGHCLKDLIVRWRAGTLGFALAVVVVVVAAAVSNHETLRAIAYAAGLPSCTSRSRRPRSRRPPSRRPKPNCCPWSKNSTPTW